jgi:hypothetical protein
MFKLNCDAQAVVAVADGEEHVHVIYGFMPTTPLGLGSRQVGALTFSFSFSAMTNYI